MNSAWGTAVPMRLVACLFTLLVASAAALAQDVVVYDDALQNGFLDYSFGGQAGDIDFASTAPVHGGAKSIAFIGDSFNAVSFAHPGGSFTTAQYPTVHFWVHGGASGGQKLRIYLELGGGTVANAALDTYIAGGAIAAGAWREVTVALAQAPLSYAGSFDRIDLQSDVAGAQPVLYLDDVTLVATVAPAANQMLIEHDVTVQSMVSDRFTWQDSAKQQRVAVLAHNDAGVAGPGGTRGGELRQFQYQTPGGTRTVNASGSYASGFGYVVSHPDGGEACLGGFDSSSLGHFRAGTFTRVFEGRHHAIFRFTQTYPRYCATDGAPASAINLPVTIDWLFSTGHDHPLWGATWDMSAVAANRLADDSRGPYGELLFDGSATEAAHSAIAGVGWGDRYKFVSTTNPVTMQSAWTWNTPNTIPYVKLWTTAVDATMGLVQTQTIAQHDAGGYWGVNRWNTTSANGNGCTVAVGGENDLMPCSFNWPYQSINYSFVSNVASTNNTRLAWGSNFGFLGQTAYYTHGGAYYGGPLPDTTASGWPKQSYSTFVVLGTHSAAPVEAQVTQVETIQSLTLSATTGTVVSSGPAGVARPEIVTYAPAGYNHVYGALAFSAATNQLDANIAVGAGTLRKPLIVVSSYTSASYPIVKLGGATLVADVDYFASLRSSASELWLTLDRDLTGPTNRVQVLQPVGAPAPTVTAVTPPSGSTAGGTPVTISGTNFANNAAVTFGGVAATNVVVVNATTITATTPAYAAGAVSVTVANPDLQTGTKSSAYTYVASDTRGDANGNGTVNGADIVFLVNRLFAGGPAPATACEADANGDGNLTAADVFFLINFVFASGSAPGGC